MSVVIEEDIIYPTFTPKCKYEPMKHQLKALEFMKEREKDYDLRGGIIALDMGLGKTFTSLYHCLMGREKSPGPTLIIAPKTALYTWVNEIKKFYGNTVSYFIFRKDENRVSTITKEELSRYNIVLTNYEYVRNLSKEKNVFSKVCLRDLQGRVFGANTPDRPVLRDTKGETLLFSMEWPRIISDESHNFSNYKTSLWRSVIALCAKSRFCLSGTPIKNSSQDLYAQYKFLGYYEPEFNVKNFHKLDLSIYIHHSDYKKAGIVLPQANHIRVACHLEGEHADIYEMFLKRANQEYNNFTVGGASFAAIFTLFLRLRQICIAPHTIVPKDDKKINTKEYFEAQEELDYMTGGMASWINDKEGTAGLKASKIEKIAEIVKGVPKGEKIVVFTMFKSVIRLLEEKLLKMEGFDKKIVCIDGGVTGKKRDECITAFKERDYDVMIVSYKIGAESLNLTEARHVVLTEAWWNSAIIDQAKARIYRIGQKHSVNIYELYVPNDDRIKSIEVAMGEICDRKKHIAEQYMTTGKCDNSANLNAETMGEILRVANKLNKD
jgi:SNF2 family DNA or RNA helicase